MKPLSILRKIVPAKKRPIKISQAARNAAVKLVAPKSPKKKSSSWLKRFFRIKRKPVKEASPPVQKPAGESKKPKNGWLVLGVMAAAIISVLLTVGNIRLIRDPAVFGKVLTNGRQQIEQPQTEKSGGDSSGTLSNQASHERPEVTFYQKLTAQDEQKKAESDIACPVLETDITDKRAVKVPSGAASEKLEDAKSKVHTPSEKTLVTGPSTLPPLAGPQRYTVQVGAFAHPSIAQEWAVKWKSRGYEVFMKPVARPNTGIIYRLYLGNFPSEKQADELVKHLKAKEGISALRLTVRN